MPLIDHPNEPLSTVCHLVTISASHLHPSWNLASLSLAFAQHPQPRTTHPLLQHYQSLTARAIACNTNGRTCPFYLFPFYHTQRKDSTMLPATHYASFSFWEASRSARKESIDRSPSPLLPDFFVKFLSFHASIHFSRLLSFFLGLSRLSHTNGQSIAFARFTIHHSDNSTQEAVDCLVWMCEWRTQNAFGIVSPALRASQGRSADGLSDALRRTASPSGATSALHRGLLLCVARPPLLPTIGQHGPVEHTHTSSTTREPW